MLVRNWPIKYQTCGLEFSCSLRNNLWSRTYKHFYMESNLKNIISKGIIPLVISHFIERHLCGNIGQIRVWTIFIYMIIIQEYTTRSPIPLGGIGIIIQVYVYDIKLKALVFLAFWTLFFKPHKQICISIIWASAFITLMEVTLQGFTSSYMLSIWIWTN